MGSPIRVLVCGGLVLFAGWGCASDDRGPALARDPRAARSQVGEIQTNIRLMLTFDANKDGQLTRDELEAGLKAEFTAADTDHNGTLNLSEIQAENARRWQASGTASSPLIDWNQDGVVGFAEFAGTAYSIFAQMDRDKGGTLAGVELEAPRIRGVARPPPRNARRQEETGA
jgi:hypothetical protein